MIYFIRFTHNDLCSLKLVFTFSHASPNLFPCVHIFKQLENVTTKAKSTDRVRPGTMDVRMNVRVTTLLRVVTVATTSRWKNLHMQQSKDADQLCSYCTADQRLCYRYTDSIARQMGHCMGGNFNIHIWAW